MTYAKPPWSYEPIGRACTHFDVVVYTPVDEHHHQVKTRRIASLVNREHVSLLVASPELCELWKEYISIMDNTSIGVVDFRSGLESIIERVRSVLKRVENGIPQT